MDHMVKFALCVLLVLVIYCLFVCISQRYWFRHRNVRNETKVWTAEIWYGPQLVDQDLHRIIQGTNNGT